MICLVVSPPLKNIFESIWDDDIPKIYGKIIKHVPVTTNQSFVVDMPKKKIVIFCSDPTWCHRFHRWLWIIQQIIPSISRILHPAGPLKPRAAPSPRRRSRPPLLRKLQAPSVGSVNFSGWCLVRHPSEKYWSVGMMIPNMCKKCSNPPTR